MRAAGARGDGDLRWAAGRARDRRAGRPPRATRCASPDRPVPRAGSAPPVPSSATLSSSTSRGPAARMAILFAKLCLAALASSSAAQKYAMVSIAGVGRTGMLTSSSTGIALSAASEARASASPLSSTGGWIPRARVRRSPSASLAPRSAASTSSRTAAASGTSPPSPSFSRAMPRFMASVASRICAPSCRFRSSRRSRAAESSTASARLSSRSWTRCASRPGPSRPRISQASADVTALVTHGAASSIAAPAAAAANVPGRVATRNVPSPNNPNGVNTGTGLSRAPGGGLRNPPTRAGNPG